MNRGYVKLWRKSKDSGFLGNADAWQLLCWCLLNATHKPHKQIIGKQMVNLEPGQVVFGRCAAAKELNTTERKIRTSLELLKKADFLTVKTTSKFSIITIVNWHSYQDERPASDQQNDQQHDQQATNKRSTNDHKQEQENISTREEKKEHTIVCLSPDESDDAKPKAKDSGFPPCPHQRIIALYHEVLPTLPRVKVWNDKRQIHLGARWRETLERLRRKGEPHDVEAGVAWWRDFFTTRVKNCPFLLGQKSDRNGRTFRADLAWLVNPDNYAKAIEGRYF